MSSCIGNRVTNMRQYERLNRILTRTLEVVALEGQATLEACDPEPRFNCANCGSLNTVNNPGVRVFGKGYHKASHQPSYIKCRQCNAVNTPTAKQLLLLAGYITTHQSRYVYDVVHEAYEILGKVKLT